MDIRCRLWTAICHASSKWCGYPGLRAHKPLTSPVTQRSRRTYNCGAKQPPHCYIGQRFSWDSMFNRTWDDYKAGFGNADGEYYVGNEIIRTLAKLGKSDVYFKLTDKGDRVVHASWKNFSIGPESDGYRLTFDRLTYSGDAGNTLNNTNPWYTHYNMEFTTSDKDADTYTSGNCADLTQGGWWFSGCYSVDLTAMTPANFVWLKDDGYYELKHAVMMIKRE
ncbi:hypothetical protein FSP39_022250 [Pinctada imbricata]|uniref:Fibrinogen C-terminal domain-containing protein n=1 Tax=Pinctada imbricata TaxID=66713 RepID=A0AA88YT29_PINIB|nr:hypothetical protein FSP39_022250 [Pinctada imbricata]